MVISQAGERRYRLTAFRVTVAYRKAGRGAGPDLIVTEYGGGAHCCWTIHAIQLGSIVHDESIEIGDSDLQLDKSVWPPRLRFYDFGFALEEEIKTGIVHWHAPLVIMRWETECRCYRPDVAAMRRPAPDRRTLAATARSLRAKLSSRRSEGRTLVPGAHELDQELWEQMVDLIYTGNAASARALLDLAWPVSRPGKSAFLAEFTEELHAGALWRRYRLGVFDGDSVFR